MQSTQLACPHCGSTLNLGGAIAAGTTVECLICMQSFAAAPIAAPSPAPAKAASEVSPAPKRPSPGVLVAKSHAAPRLEKTSHASPASRREAPAQSGGKSTLVLVAVSLLVLLAGGVCFAIWKITEAHRTGAAPGKEMVAANPTPTPPKDDAKSEPVVPAKVSDPKVNNTKPPLEEDPDDDRIRKSKEAEKKQLTRNPNLKSDAKELDFDPITTIKVSQPKVGGLDQEKINAAIAKGVASLKNTQGGIGTWAGGNYDVGYSALGGLTLLECNVPPNDVTVQRAALHVRSSVVGLNGTYEIALAILFLDRLGEARDRPLIQGLALRLLAGQNDCGGWSYFCPVLNPQEMYQLYSFLQSNKKPAMKNPLATDGKNNPPLQPVERKANKTDNPFEQLGDLIDKQGEGVEPKAPPPDKKPPVNVMKPKGKFPPIRVDMLAPNLRNIPGVKNQGQAKGRFILRDGTGDNSNTQFALLALWAARRHDIPSEQGLLTAYQRFITTQHALDHGWPYWVGQGSTPSMTCVGLLGLAMGHGVEKEVAGVNPNNPKDVIVKPALEDPRIKNGLKALARTIGEPSLDAKQTNFPMQNLYLLWSVERVAMLYELKSIEGKDWYGWGAQTLVFNQHDQGHWTSSAFHGSTPHVNTCLALLFLKRSNLVQDLTVNLRLHTAIRDPEK